MLADFTPLRPRNLGVLAAYARKVFEGFAERLPMLQIVGQRLAPITATKITTVAIRRAIPPVIWVPPFSCA